MNCLISQGRQETLKISAKYDNILLNIRAQAKTMIASSGDFPSKFLGVDSTADKAEAYSISKFVWETHLQMNKPICDYKGNWNPKQAICKYMLTFD